MCNNQEMDSRVDKEGKKSCENTMLEVVAPHSPQLKARVPTSWILKPSLRVEEMLSDNVLI